ncbi:MAG: efflux RND transporter periplasmic adaptor subunit [Alcanivoracaceae bacterium]|nr:efflux RND transporter periplasmic adaptor subunit [Alcanivoracaceae bacterium]
MKKAVVLLIAVLAGLVWWWTGSAPKKSMQRPASVVNVVAPRQAELASEIEGVGTAQARASINLTSEVDGRLLSVNFKEGDKVKAGAKLVALDDRIARAQLARADAQLADARAAWERAQQLKSSEVLSKAEADTLQAGLLSAQADRDAAASTLADYTVRAPFAGVVGLRRVNTGSYVKSGDVLTTLDDLDELEILFSVPEKHLGQIASGQTIFVESSSYPDRVFDAHLSQIDTRVDPVNRTVTVKATMTNTERLLLPGQFLNVRLLTGNRLALMIPEQAVLTEGASSFAYVVNDSTAERREVKTGVREQGWVEVLSGIALDEQVIVNGHARLGTGSKVDVREDASALMPDTQRAFLNEPAFQDQ